MLNYCANGPSGYTLSNSLRFRQSASAYLNRTPASAGNRQKFTWSAWVKRGSLGSAQTLLSGGATGGTGTAQFIGFDTNDTFFFSNYNIGNVQTTQVFRDPSAWYHIVLAVDTTQATASNRVIMYVNGVQVTSYSATTYPAQNTNLYINTNEIQSIGKASWSGLYYFDGYQTEVNFIDGQALTPSSFGSTNSTTGVWQPAKYTGTYGTNGFYLPFIPSSTSSYAGSFNGSSQSLSIASNSVFGYGTGDFTMEGWFYLNDLSTRTLMSNLTSNPQVAPHIYSNAGVITYYVNGANVITGSTLAVNNWYHIALSKNSNSTKLYVNGIQVGSTYSDTNNYGTSLPFIIADYAVPVSGVSQFNGKISNIRVVKGTGLYPSNFSPSSAPLTAVSGTSILTLQNATIIDNSGNSLSITNNGTVTTATATPFVANIAGDKSGNNNNWTPNNINYSTVGTTYDSMTDVPTLTSATVANYAVLNTLDKTAGTVSNGNLTIVKGSTGAFANIRGTMSVSSGKWYYETTLTSGINYSTLGILSPDVAFPSQIGDSAYGWDWYPAFAEKKNNGTSVAYGTTASAGDVIMCAFDVTNGKIWWGKNGTWFASGDPAAGTNAAFTNVTGTVAPAIAVSGTTTQLDANFGQRPFSYTPPTGFVALNTYNLPTPTILQGNKYMNATTYTGTGGFQSITNAGSMQPDLLWIKSRSNAVNNVLIDSVRGNSLYLVSNSTAAEVNNGGPYILFNSDGFSVGADSQSGANGYTYVAWQWKANAGTNTTNTAGSITSTVSVNASAGFSVVTYTGTGANATVGHGLGVAPKMVIIKNRTASATAWNVYQASIPSGNLLSLNSTAASFASTNRITAVSSTTFSIGADSDVNGSTNSHVAYCWAEIAGFSKFTSYTGNGSADGVFVYLGFRPKYVLTKRTDTTSDWIIYDTSRNTYNVSDLRLYPNLSNAETQAGGMDLLSNGFKLRDTGASQNASGGTYIVAAWAENPFKNSLAR